MSLWRKLTHFIAGRSDPFDCEIEECGPGRRVDHADFAMALIGLGAKMAKADGVVTTDEIEAFRRVFRAPKEGEEAIARLFNARTVSIPTLPCLFRKYQVKKGDKMSKLHSLLDDQVFYGTPPAEIVLGTGSDLFYNSKERSDADVATFYRNYFRFGSPPLSTVGSEVVLYGLVRDAQRCDFVFPGTPQYRNCLTTVNNEKYMPPAVAEKKRRRICERIRERHAKRVARRQAR